jgi:FMN reductase
VDIFVLGIGGTTREGSSTEKALAVSLAAAAQHGADTLMMSGADLVLPMYEPEKAERSPGAARLVKEIKRAHGVIVASPGYHGTISGLVKNALDYVEDLRDEDRPYLDDRAVGCVAVARGWQATVSTLIALRSVVHALRGWPTPMGAAINSSLAIFDEEGTCIDDAARFQLEMVGHQVVDFAQMRAVWS